ncbi:MAG TPA: RagB/SusD family nutrient uptake outer membrane protein [Flavobacterium sp.]|nr:RagB/SusD family nutrient uptake outer membrane protein [Flavobacterium sp.]
MKKLKIILLLAIGSFLFSCEDAYRIEQDGEFGEAATFRTVQDMQLFLNEAYDRATTANEIEFTAIFTDEVGIGSQNAGQNIDVFQYTLNPVTTLPSDMWLDHYILINYANRLIRGAQRITPAASETATYNSIIAQARALRAFGHFQLLTYFSQNIKDNNALGVILMDRVPDVSEELPRSTNGEVFALIESDLAFASANLVNPTGPNAYKFITSNFINAFRARMYAYRGNYTLASQYADQVIATSGLTLTPATPYVPGNFYTASTTNPYRQMWADINQGEIIFALDRPAGKDAIGNRFYFNRTNLTGGPFHDMGRNLFNLLESVPGDIRRRAYIDPTSVIAANPATVVNYKAGDILLIDKYPGKAGADLTNNLKVFRLSEMYFIKAEALASTGNLNGASNSVAAILKQVRDARNFLGPQPLPNYASATEAWADILKERRIELAFEGHRYVDLKRLGALANATIDRYFRDCQENNLSVCTLPVTDYRFTLPIPQDELIGNRNIQQNSGY